MKSAVTFYKVLKTITWDTLALCHPDRKPIAAWWRCLEKELLTTSSQRSEVILEAAVREHKDFAISILAAYSLWVLSHGFQKDGMFS